MMQQLAHVESHKTQSSFLKPWHTEVHVHYTAAACLPSWNPGVQKYTHTVGACVILLVFKCDHETF